MSGRLLLLLPLLLLSPQPVAVVDVVLDLIKEATASERLIGRPVGLEGIKTLLERLLLGRLLLLCSEGRLLLLLSECCLLLLLLLGSLLTADSLLSLSLGGLLSLSLGSLLSLSLGGLLSLSLCSLLPLNCQLALDVSLALGGLITLSLGWTVLDGAVIADKEAARVEVVTGRLVVNLAKASGPGKGWHRLPVATAAY